MAEPMGRSTFFDSNDDPELGDKQKSRSRRASFRKTLSLITESRRSVDISNNPLSPASPRHRRSFSFHRRASSSVTSVASQADIPQSPMQYYNDPEARMKLKAVVASPESFDQALEHGFPSTTKLDAMHDGAPNIPRTRANTTGSKQTRGPYEYEAEAITFFDSSSVDSEEEDEDEHHRHRSQDLRAGSALEQTRHFEYQSYPTDHNLDSDEDDYGSSSDNDSPVTPNWGDGTSRVASPIRPEVCLDQDSHTPFGGTQFTEHPSWDGGHWAGGPREMTLRMTLTKPELRAPEEQLYGWHESSQKAALALPKIKDHTTSSSAVPKAADDYKTRARPPATVVNTHSTTKKPGSNPKSSTADPRKSNSQSHKSSTETKASPSTPSPGKVRGLWRKVKERKG